MIEPITWRTFLGQLIQHTEHRQHIAAALSVNPLTLTRWVKGISNPQPRKIFRLLSLLSEQQRAEMLPLVVRDFPGFSFTSMEELEENKIVSEIPAAFYASILEMLSAASRPQSMWSIQRLILQQAYEHLDPQHQCVAVMLARCVPPGNGRSVRSIYIALGAGITPWGGEVEHQRIFLGIESVPGQAVASGRPITIQNTQHQWTERPEGAFGIASITVYPIMCDNQIVGAFSAICTQTEYWIPSRLTLMEQYAALLSSTFSLQDFYYLDDLVLNIMPLPPEQLPHLARFRERVNTLLKTATNQDQLVTLLQAEQIVWQQLEEELIQLALSKS